MAKKKSPTPEVQEAATGPVEYTVVARRYRPQQFADLIGQEHVAAALVNALQSGRVAHAYLFTGARGVGKTSAARILAKALNCVEGPTPTPCDKCDSCKAIALGEDVDVVEIDGASNNKVDEARDIRQNVGFRPTRSRYKIYIIDEVHMLTTQAFNALLKTLEEPPPHVKFILATTEVQKIPITILSRCQRFDFAFVGPGKIFEQLKRIVEKEGHKADDDALKIISRRAGGSMRDSQSLLDQLLASSNETITVERVHAILGTSGDERTAQLATAILNRDAKSGLELIATWAERGLQVGELVDQLIAYWRSLMLVNCGGPEIRDLPVSPSQKDLVLVHSKQASLDTILAGLEVWTATKGRMRDSIHSQVLLEMAVVRLARMEEMLSVGQLAVALTQPGTTLQVSGTSLAKQATSIAGADGGAKKNETLNELPGPDEVPERSEYSPLVLAESTVSEIWSRLNRYLNEKSPILATHLKQASLPAIFGPNSLAIRFESRYNSACEACASSGNRARIEDALQKVTGRPITTRFDLVVGAQGVGQSPSAAMPQKAPDLKKQLMNMPIFQKATEVLGAQIWHVDDEFNPVAPPKPTTTIPTPEDDHDEI